MLRLHRRINPATRVYFLLMGLGSGWSRKRRVAEAAGRESGGSSKRRVAEAAGRGGSGYALRDLRLFE